MKRSAEYLLVIVLALFLFMKGVVPAWKEPHSDFVNYYVSAKMVVAGDSLDRLYDNQWFQQKINSYGLNTIGKFSPFPPITALMMLPLTPFEPIVAQRIFLFINLIFIGLGIICLQRLTRLKSIHCALLILGSGLSLVNNLAFGQVYWIMTVFILLSILLCQRNLVVAAGCILGIFTALKYFPVVFIAGFFLILTVPGKNSLPAGAQKADLRIVISSVLMLVMLIVLQFLVFGPRVMSEFYTSVFLPHLDGELSGQGLYSFQFQSWDNLFRNLFVRNTEFNPSPFLDWPNGKTVMKTVVTVTVGAVTLHTLYRYRNASAPIKKAVYLSLPSITALVMLPASATYHFVLMIIPLALLLREHTLNKKSAVICIALYVAIGFIPYSWAFQLGKSWGLLFAYPRLWLVCLFYIVIVFNLLRKTEQVSTIPVKE